MLAFAWAGITYVSFPAFRKQAGQAAIANCVDLKAVNFTGTEEPAAEIRVFDNSCARSNVFAPVDYEGDALFGFPVYDSYLRITSACIISSPIIHHIRL